MTHRMTSIPALVLRHRLRRLSLANGPVGVTCLLLAAFRYHSVADRMPLLLTAVECGGGVLAYWLLLRKYPAFSLATWMAGKILYFTCLLAVLGILAQAVVTMTGQGGAWASPASIVVVGFVLIDGVEHFMYKVLDGRERWTMTRPGRKAHFRENYGGALWQLIRRYGQQSTARK